MAMKFTPHHSTYWAYQLQSAGEHGTLDRLTPSLNSAQVDLNPHQVEAALFALWSPLRKGVILADEVGLGKTIEAGLVIAQRWAERKKTILLVVPATLRKQWQQELLDKFFIAATILESPKRKQQPEIETQKLYICSYQYAAKHSLLLQHQSWDLVVIDEAHKLRNVYKKGTSLAAKIKKAFAAHHKILLTATPLQNSLQELYGLVSVLDEHVFGDLKTFRRQFDASENREEDYQQLKERLRPLLKRTLRSQVLEYIKYTKRIAITQEFFPTDEEQELYDQVSEYLQREVLAALPVSQRSLMTLVLRKLLASSTFAIAGTLHKLYQRLDDVARDESDLLSPEDFESLDELQEEWDSEDTASSPVNLQAVQAERADLKHYAHLAEVISHNAKGDALLRALEQAFAQLQDLGAERKAVIFTESRRTQDYLFDLLSANGYQGELVCMNGSNVDSHSQSLYRAWLKQHQGTARVSGSKTADMKAAIVEAFQHQKTILIATESAAEGVNLQFCSLVVNYDLPWNPQRVEQRIGRCHRYGQKHDVVVVNFLNQRNQADARVFELLAQKFKLFDGVFGASDEILGALESGVDIEKRIAKVYQECRTHEEINAAFDALQAELSPEIEDRVQQTKKTFMDHFDEDIHQYIRVDKTNASQKLDAHQKLLLQFTQNEINPHLSPDGFIDAHTGKRYTLDWRKADDGTEFYHVQHRFVQDLIQHAQNRPLGIKQLNMDLSGYDKKISVLESHKGQTGWLELALLTLKSAKHEEDFLLLSGCTEHGEILDEEVCAKLLQLSAEAVPCSDTPPEMLNDIRHNLVKNKAQQAADRNTTYFDEEVKKLDAWAEDSKAGLELEIKELDKDIKELKKAARLCKTMQDKLEMQKKVKSTEALRSKKRREVYEASDRIDAEHGDLLTRVEQQLKQAPQDRILFRVKWQLI